MNRNYFVALLSALVLAVGCTSEQTTTPASTETTTSDASKQTDATSNDSKTPAPQDESTAPAENATSAEPEMPAIPENALTIGSKAPSLDIEHWVSDGHGAFQAVTDFAADKVYVVEFWATWCPPCVASMPHLVELQEKHKDAVQIISVSDEDLETVTKFLEKPYTDGGDDGPATYGELTSAYCLTTDPDRTVGKSYMEAAGQNGIPACFLVGKTGQIEWIGHPMGLDEPLAKVLDGSWDRDAYAKEFQKEQMFGVIMGQIYEAFQGGDNEKVQKLLEQGRKIAGPRELMQLEQMEMNLKMAPIAKKMQSGDVDGAVADMQALIDSADGPIKEQLGAVLENLKKAAEQMKAATTEGATEAVAE